MKPAPTTQSAKIADSKKDGIIISSQSQGWENILVEECSLPPGEVKHLSLAEHAICLGLATRPYYLQQVMGDRRYVSLYNKGDITIAPAQTTYSYKWWDGYDHYLLMRIASDFMQKVAIEAVEVDPNQIELLPEFRVRNPQIEQIGTMLHFELMNGGLAGRLYVESLTNVLAVHLLRNYATTKPRIALYNGGLSDRQLLIVTDYINDHLAEDIKLSDLSQLLGMSQFHFSRLFKQSMGISPHQYVIKQRIERAKLLLKQAELSVVEVALQCGFNSHSHLGKHFRQLTGMTPKAYANSLQSKAIISCCC